MAIPTKGSRRISVDNQQYTWVASGNDGWIDLLICASTRSGQKLLASFGYHQTLIPEEGGSYRIVSGSQFIITPAVVREVILYGLSHGWHPLEKGSDLQLKQLDEEIEAVRLFLATKPGTNSESSTFSPHPA